MGYHGGGEGRGVIGGKECKNGKERKVADELKCRKEAGLNGRSDGFRMMLSARLCNGAFGQKYLLARRRGTCSWEDEEERANPPLGRITTFVVNNNPSELPRRHYLSHM